MHGVLKLNEQATTSRGNSAAAAVEAADAFGACRFIHHKTKSYAL